MCWLDDVPACILYPQSYIPILGLVGSLGRLWPSDDDDDVPVLSQFVCVGAGGQESPLES